MHISLNWIRDFAAVPALAARELASRFTLATAEVEGVSVTGEGLELVQIVHILSKRPHPEADKLNLVTFDLGNGSQKEVVCGAPNVKEGLKVFYAPVGTVLPNGLKLEPKKIRGVLSDGMLCSETELGLGQGSAGLMELPASATVGQKFLDYQKIKPDVILEVDNKSLTHRPDLWGHFGLAREFAVSHEIPFNNRFDHAWFKKMEGQIPGGASPISFDVAADSSCWAYLGVSLKNVKVSGSPAWIKERLVACGLRPINNLVDASNYVMLELGMPNHIFDADQISGKKLSIRRNGTDSVFKTLDEQDRVLIANDTVIADSNGPAVLAGIMGGLHSGVSETTKNIFIEVANWDPAEVRKTSVRLGLRSDSSQRFEKTLDSHQCYRTLLRLVELIKEICPEATVEGGVQTYLNEAKLARPVKLSITGRKINSVLGHEVPAKKVQQVFSGLGFGMEVMGDEYHLEIPTYRTTKDISCEADLVEEIGRMVGYDNITSVSPLLGVRPVRFSTSKQLQRKVQDFLVQETRALEVMTYPLVGPELLEKALWPVKNEKLILVNALSVDNDRMRPSVVPSAIQLVSENQKQYSDFAFFELGRSYLDHEKERTHLVIGMYSKTAARFLELTNHVERLLSFLGLPVEFAEFSEKFANPLMPAEWKGRHPHEYINLRIQGKFQGVITTIHPMIMKNFKAKGHFSCAVIDLTDFENRESKDKTKYRPIAKFPSSTLDVSVAALKDVPAGQVLKALDAIKLKELKSKSILDVFAFSETHKSVTLRIVWEDTEATLTAEMLKNGEQQVIQTLEKAGFPLRS